MHIKYKNAVVSWVIGPIALLFAVPTMGGQTNKCFAVSGIVENIAANLSQITVHHEAILGYMGEMTMDFSVKNTNELRNISIHDEIAFNLVVNTEEEWIQDIKKLGHIAEATSAAASHQMKMPIDRSLRELKSGDLLPDYILTSESGKEFKISDFRGSALAFTFFFTRCPLPDYCPLMNKDFRNVRKLLRADEHAPTNWQLLSISFDPHFDSGKVLSDYAIIYRGEDSNRWLFASAPTNVLAAAASQLDLMIMRQGNNLSHNLRTVVLDTNGRIFKQFDGNRWTPEELANAMKQAAQPPQDANRGLPKHP